MSKSIELSVVVITFNEENNIERCLSSVIAVADEIVVVDSFSTDNTKVICQKYNVRFITHRFDGYIEQRNWASQQANSEYVLMLDADEALSEELVQAIKQVKNNWTHDGYSFNRLNNYCGTWIRHSGWYPDRKLRLYDRRKAYCTGRNPHDKVELDKGAMQKHITGDLLHYTYYNIDEQVLQADRFSTIAAQDLVKQHQRIYLVRLIINPLVKFIRTYFFNLGFLDGFYGLVVCAITAHGTFLKYAKAYHLAKQAKKG